MEVAIKLPDNWVDEVIERLKEDGTLSPVVRCKDCIHLGFKDFSGICEGGPMCGIVTPDDYCSHGVRKDGK